jgi:hypothetical protein
VAPKILALGIGDEKFVISFDWNVPIAIDVAAAEPQIEMMPVVIVRDRSQGP